MTEKKFRSFIPELFAVGAIANVTVATLFFITCFGDWVYMSLSMSCLCLGVVAAWIAFEEHALEADE